MPQSRLVCTILITLCLLLGFHSSAHGLGNGNSGATVGVDQVALSQEQPMRGHGLKPHLFPPAGEFGGAARSDDKGNRHIPMGKKAKAILPSRADDFTYIYEDRGAALGLRLLSSRPNSLVFSENSRNHALYPEVLKGVDMTVDVTERGYKDTLHVAEPPDSDTWTYEMVFVGLEPQWNDGILQFVAPADGSPRFRLGELVARDAAGEVVGLNASMRIDDDGSAWLDVTVPASWLKRAAYPIEIDPAVVPVVGSTNGTVVSSGIASAVRNSSGVLSVLTNTTYALLTSVDGGANWRQPFSPHTISNGRLLSVGSRTYFFYSRWADGNDYGIYYRYQEGASSTWSDEIPVVNQLDSLPAWVVSGTTDQLMLLFAPTSLDVRAAISVDGGSTWSFSTLPVSPYTGALALAGIQYYQSQYVAVMEWRDGTDPVSGAWQPGTSIVTTAVAFTAPSPSGSWAGSILFQDSTMANLSPGNTYAHPSYVSDLKNPGSGIVFNESHYAVDPTCVGRTSGKSYWTADGYVCGDQSENNIQIRTTRVMNEDLSWTAHSGWWTSGGVLIQENVSTRIMYQDDTGFSEFDLASRTWGSRYNHYDGRVIEPVNGSTVESVGSIYAGNTALKYVSSAGDTQPPAFLSSTITQTCVSSSIMVSPSVGDDFAIGPLELWLDGTISATTSAVTSSTVTVPALSEGQHTLQLIVPDWNGNRSLPFTKTIWGGLPAIASPAPNQTITASQIASSPPRLKLTSAGNCGITRADFYLTGPDGTQKMVPTTQQVSGSWEANWPSTANKAGTWTVKALIIEEGSLSYWTEAITEQVINDTAGTLSLPFTKVSAGQSGLTLPFTYRAGAVLSNGTISVTIPAGWAPPSVAPGAPGYTTASAGTVSVSGQVISVSEVNLAAGETVAITYGERNGGGPGATSPVATGAGSFTASILLTTGGTVLALSGPPTVTVYGADGAGTMTVNTPAVSAGQPGATISFTYTAGTGGTSSGMITLAVPPGWTAPSADVTQPGYVKSSRGSVTVSGQTFSVSGLSLTAGQTVTITYGDRTFGGPGATVTDAPGQGSFLAQEKSTPGGVMTALVVQPAVVVYGADGSGLLTTTVSTASGGQSGLTLPFTFTAGPGGMNNGAFVMDVPTGWSAPSTTPTADGYTTANVGTASTNGQSITVSGVTLAEGATLIITYGDRSGGGPGVTSSTTPGVATFAARSRATASGTLTSLLGSPWVTITGTDGTGTLELPVSSVSAGQTGISLTFTYTAGANAMNDGTVTLTVPPEWSAPSPTSNDAGYTTASTGNVSVSSRTITVSGVTLASGQTMNITYGDRSGGGPGATSPTTAGQATFFGQETSTATGTLTALSLSPTISVIADGSGTLTLPFTEVSAGQSALNLPFTYTAGAGGTDNATLTIAVPEGWSAPSTKAAVSGYTTVTNGTLSVAGQTITVSGVTLSPGGGFTVTYNGVPPLTPGYTVFAAKEKSTAGGTLMPLAESPAVTVYGASGTGTLTLPPTDLQFGQTGTSLTFTYTAAESISNGAVKLLVPSGFSSPSTAPTAAGYVTASAGTVSVSGSYITVSGVTLAPGGTLTITYGDRSGGGPGVTSYSTGTVSFWAAVQSTPQSFAVPLSAWPGPTVYRDGSAWLSLPVSAVSGGQTGLTLPFTVGSAVMIDGAITLTVPTGWSAPSTNSTDPGYTTANAGAVTVSGQTITVAGLTLAPGETFAITYGDRSGGGPGATSSTTYGVSQFTVMHKALASGTLTEGPAAHVTVYAADGTGALTLPASSAPAGTSGLTLPFTYSAATGGTNNGSITVIIPDGWSAPSKTATNPGFTRASLGYLSVSGQTITVSGVTLPTGGTLTITYGDRSGGGPGATSAVTPGAASFVGTEKSTLDGANTALVASPGLTITPDGTGSLALPVTTLPAGAGGLTLPFTYTAGLGGVDSGTIAVTVPAGWSTPSTHVTDPGFTTASRGIVSVVGQTITVSNVSLPGGGTMAITYGDRSGDGPGVTSPTTFSTVVFVAQEQSTAAGTLTALSTGVTVTAGGPSLAVATSNVSASQSRLSLVFTYTSDAGGSTNGSVILTVPTGWSEPSTHPADGGYTTASTGAVSVSGETITISGVTLAAGGTMTIIYGDKVGGGPGATCQSIPGTAVFSAQAKSTEGGALAMVTIPPRVMVYSADGSGTLTASSSIVSAYQRLTLPLTYTAADGGMNNGTITVFVPWGWSSPSTSPGEWGYTTSSKGVLSVGGNLITVSG